MRELLDRLKGPMLLKIALAAVLIIITVGIAGQAFGQAVHSPEANCREVSNQNGEFLVCTEPSPLQICELVEEYPRAKNLADARGLILAGMGRISGQAGFVMVDPEDNLSYGELWRPRDGGRKVCLHESATRLEGEAL